MKARGAQQSPATLPQLKLAMDRLVRSVEDVSCSNRLTRFAVEFERAMYEGRIDPDAIPRDLLMILADSIQEIAA